MHGQASLGTALKKLRTYGGTLLDSRVREHDREGLTVGNADSRRTVEELRLINGTPFAVSAALRMDDRYESPVNFPGCD